MAGLSHTVPGRRNEDLMPRAPHHLTSPLPLYPFSIPPSPLLRPLVSLPWCRTSNLSILPLIPTSISYPSFLPVSSSPTPFLSFLSPCLIFPYPFLILSLPPSILPLPLLQHFYSHLPSLSLLLHRDLHPPHYPPLILSVKPPSSFSSLLHHFLPLPLPLFSPIP